MRHSVIVLSGLVLVAVVAGVAVAGPQKWWINEDLGRTESQRLEAQKSASDQFWARYAVWLDQELAKGRNLRDYPVAEQMVLVAEPMPTLAEAVRAAAVIFHGRVVVTTPRASADTVVTLIVDKTFKGNTGSQIEIVLPDAIFPDLNWNPILGTVEALPMLFVGDTVHLLLIPSGLGDGRYTPQSWTGTYREEAGRIRSVTGNPFAPHVDGLTPADFEARINSLLIGT